MSDNANNICRFVSGNHAPDVVQTVNFVYETKLHGDGTNRMALTARIYFVTSGTATIQCGGCTGPVRKGDIFFLLPAVNYAITGSEDFCYMYISFIGLRAGILLERLKITSRNFIFPGCGELESLWRNAISLPADMMDLASESVLLYTLAHIGQPKETVKQSAVTAAAEKMLLPAAVKEYAEESMPLAAAALSAAAKS